MSDDLLERATRALHDEGAAPAEELAETRARVLASASGAQGRRARALRWVLPLAAVFLAGSAFAATNGGIERAVRHLQTWIADAPAPPQKPQKPKPARATPAPANEAPAQAAPAVEPPQVVAPAPVAAVESAQPVARRKRVQEPAPSAPPVELPAPDAVAEVAPPTPQAANPDLALYREAHQLHFKAQAHARALAVWDAYLARFPAGMFAEEARYNRAICLVRLGKRREAIGALEPFAAGRVGGGYRREEAQKLLDALRGAP